MIIIIILLYNDMYVSMYHKLMDLIKLRKAIILLIAKVYCYSHQSDVIKCLAIRITQESKSIIKTLLSESNIITHLYNILAINIYNNYKLFF